MAVNDEQQKFLEQLALRIPRLFDVIRAGNIKSEYIMGVRRVGRRLVRLKMVAEVVDPGANPLRTHGMHAPTEAKVQTAATPGSKVNPHDGSVDPPSTEDDSGSRTGF